MSYSLADNCLAVPIIMNSLHTAISKHRFQIVENNYTNTFHLLQEKCSHLNKQKTVFPYSTFFSYLLHYCGKAP